MQTDRTSGPEERVKSERERRRFRSVPRRNRRVEGGFQVLVFEREHFERLAIAGLDVIESRARANFDEILGMRLPQIALELELAMQARFGISAHGLEHADSTWRGRSPQNRFVDQALEHID